MSKYNFIIADNQVIVRNGLSIFIKNIYPFSTVHKVSTLVEILKLISSEKVDLLILDVNFSNGISLFVIPTIKKLQSTIKILIFSAFDENMYAIRYLNEGANGYLNKLCTESDIKQAIDDILITGRYASKNIQNKILDTIILKKNSSSFEKLSNREIEIAKFYVEGLNNSSICNVLSIRKSTVSTYKKRIFEKLEINSLSALIDLYNIYHK